MRYTLLALLSIVTIVSNGQDPNSQNILALKYETIEGCPVILATPPNLSKMLFAGMSDFKVTMKKYVYSLLTDGSGYSAGTPAGGSLFTITKESDNVLMSFIPDNNNFAVNFRNLLRKGISGVKVSYENGAETYRIRFTYQDIQYSMKILIKEDAGFSMVAFILQ